MNFARNSHGICVFRDHIYVAGGCVDEGGYTAECERYNFDTEYPKSYGKWEKVAPLNAPSLGPCLANFNDRYIFKFGGLAGVNQPNNMIERYDPNIDKWIEIRCNLFGFDDLS